MHWALQSRQWSSSRPRPVHCSACKPWSCSGLFPCIATADCKRARDSPAIGLPSLVGLWGTAAPLMMGQHLQLREGNLSGASQMVLSQGEGWRTKPREMMESSSKRKSSGKWPMLGRTGRCGWDEQMNPFSYASCVKFWGLHLYKKVQGSQDAGIALEHPQLALISGKERRKPAALNWRGATWAAGHKRLVSPRGFDQGCVSATRSDEAAWQLCYLGSCLGENVSLEEASCLISTLAAWTEIYAIFYISQIYREEQSENRWGIKNNSY